LAAAAELDSLLVPLGDGALLAGVGTAIRHIAPAARIMRAGTSSMQRSLAAGQLLGTGAPIHS
jgi:threonine dehydratase